MDATSIESVQQLHKVVNVHGARSSLLESGAGKYLLHQGPDVEVGRDRSALQRAVHLVVLLHHQLHAGLAKGRAQRLVLSGQV